MADAPWAPLQSSPQFESHPAFDPVTGDLHFVRSSPRFSGWTILTSRCEPGGWSAPRPSPFAGDGVEADPFFTADGRRAYFISSRRDPPAKIGDDLDVWFADRLPSGGWAPARRMPAPVNSAGAEWFPRLAEDGSLYFGSDRPGGFGATDIYRARPVGTGWRVANVGAPVSSGGDEYEFEPGRGGSAAVLMADGLLFSLRAVRGGWSERRRLLPEDDSFQVGPLLSPSGRTLLFSRRAAEMSGEILRLPMGPGRETWPRGCPRR